MVDDENNRISGFFVRKLFSPPYHRCWVFIQYNNETLCPTGLHPAEQLTHYSPDSRSENVWSSDSSPASPGAPYPPSPTSSHASSQSSQRRDAVGVKITSQVTRNSYSSGSGAHINLSATTSNASTEPDDFSVPQRTSQTHQIQPDWLLSDGSRKYSADVMSSSSDMLPGSVPADSIHYERRSYGGEFLMHWSLLSVDDVSHVILICCYLHWYRLITHRG